METWLPTLNLRVMRDASITSFAVEFRRPDRLQQAWMCRETGIHEWRDVEVVLDKGPTK